MYTPVVLRHNYLVEVNKLLSACIIFYNYFNLEINFSNRIFTRGIRPKTNHLPYYCTIHSVASTRTVAILNPLPPRIEKNV